MSEDLNLISLKINQHNQILDQYRTNFFNVELRSNLIIKMLEEKGIFVPGEFEKRWPVYLKNDVGVPGPNGEIEGNLKVTFYGQEK